MVSARESGFGLKGSERMTQTRGQKKHPMGVLPYLKLYLISNVDLGEVCAGLGLTGKGTGDETPSSLDALRIMSEVAAGPRAVATSL
jgi:hypothetical protein